MIAGEGGQLGEHDNPILAGLARAVQRPAIRIFDSTVNQSPVFADPPTYDRPAVERWSRVAPLSTPWLHGEVASRMLDRLQWFRHKPQVWTHWSPLLSGLAVHQALVQACGRQVSLVESEPSRLAHARRLLGRPWWHWARWREAAPSWQEPEPNSQDMIWANLVLHTQAQPQAQLAHWQRLLRLDGFLMFSCLGPDTAVELRQVYERMGWPAAGAEFTDMHDWGDMLVGSGFAEPVMDMERLTLTFETAQALLAELRQWGRNVHPGRFAGLRGRRWRSQLIDAIEQHGPRHSDGRLRLTVELVYGHALKAAARLKVEAVSAISLDQMREQLRQERPQ